MKASLLCFAMALLTLYVTAQEKTSSPVLVFSGSTASFNYGFGRNQSVDTSFGSYNAFSIGTGISYGRWKGNTLKYIGLSLGIGRSALRGGQVISNYTIGPVAGIMKHYEIGGHLYYAPFGEAYFSYSSFKNKIPSRPIERSNGYMGGLMVSPFSFALKATKKMDFLLSIGRIDAYYVSQNYPSSGAGQDATQNGSINFVAQLNAMNFRLLLSL